MNKDMAKGIIRALEIKEENTNLRTDLLKLQRINEIQKRTIDRWCPCPDHRDKTPPNYCPVCTNETLRNKQAKAEKIALYLAEGWDVIEDPLYVELGAKKENAIREWIMKNA